MKFLSSLLILLALIHLQCGGSCLIEAFGGPLAPQEATSTASTAPPCHHHEQAPGKDQQSSSDQTNSPCTQGQLIESKLQKSGKVLLQIAGMLPADAPVLQANDGSLRIFVPETPRIDLTSPVPVSVLRI